MACFVDAGEYRRRMTGFGEGHERAGAPVQRRHRWRGQKSGGMSWIILFALVGRNVGERGTYADGHIDEVVGTRSMRQVEDTDPRRGSGSPLRGEEQELVGEAARPTSSVPVNAKTAQTPLYPFPNALLVVLG